MIKTLSNEAICELCPMDCKGATTECGYFLINKSVARKAESELLKQVVEWLEENFTKVTGGLVKPYRFINEDNLQAKLKEWEAKQ